MSGWIVQLDPRTGQSYYYNTETGESNWEKPTNFIPSQTNVENEAAVKIQSLFRGHRVRQVADWNKAASNKWIQQYDPSSHASYYYNTETGESQWTIPSDFKIGGTDEKNQAAVIIQTAYRAKRARKIVQEMKKMLQKKDEITKSKKWYEQYDPISGYHYYYNPDTKETTWEKPEEVSAAGENEMLTSVLKIQCAFRTQKARKTLIIKRNEAQKKKHAEDHFKEEKTTVYQDRVLKPVSSFNGEVIQTRQNMLKKNKSEVQEKISPTKKAAHDNVKVTSQLSRTSSALRSAATYKTKSPPGSPTKMNSVERKSIKASQELLPKKGNAKSGTSGAAIKEAKGLLQKLESDEPCIISGVEPSVAMSKVIWIQCFDPNEKKYYYFNVQTNESQWDKPLNYVQALLDKKMSAVVKIQCALRSRKARIQAGVQKKKRTEIFQAITNGSVKNDKVFKRMSIEKVEKLQYKQIAGVHAVYHKIAQQMKEMALSEREKRLFPHHFKLYEQHQGELSLILKSQSDIKRQMIYHGGEDALNDHISSVHSRYIAFLDSMKKDTLSFFEVYSDRILENFKEWTLLRATMKPLKAFHQRQKKIATRNRSSSSKEVVEFQKTFERLQQLAQKMEKELKAFMGLDGYAQGVIKKSIPKGTNTSDFYQQVQALNSTLLEYKTVFYQALEIEQNIKDVEHELIERTFMLEEEQSTRAIDRHSIDIARTKQQHTEFLQTCYTHWNEGVELRNQDMTRRNQMEVEEENSRRANKLRALENARAAKIHRMKRKTSIWEAVQQGMSVEKIQELQQHEVEIMEKKARTFHVLEPHPETGETLIQIACWWGHQHLVEYFLDQGADIFRVDSFANRFTLLHDAARSGKKQVVQQLLDAGLSPHVLDSSSETPLHLAARGNHLPVVQCILNFDTSEDAGMSSVWKCLAQRNNRGRRASQVTQHTIIRKLLLEREEELPAREERERKKEKQQALEQQLDNNTDSTKQNNKRKKILGKQKQEEVAEAREKVSLANESKTNSNLDVHEEIKISEKGEENIGARRAKELSIKRMTKKAVQLLKRGLSQSEFTS